MIESHSQRLKTAPPLRLEPITGKGDPHGMVPVPQAGAEVSTTFWAKLAGHRGAGATRDSHANELEGKKGFLQLSPSADCMTL